MQQEVHDQPERHRPAVVTLLFLVRVGSKSQALIARSLIYS